MKNKLIYKFLGGFIVSTILSFITISFLCSYLTYQHEYDETLSHMYDETNYIAANYGSSYYSGAMSLEGMNNQLAAVDIYTGCDIMFFSTNGVNVLNTGTNVITAVKNLDPSDFDERNSMQGTFYGVYQEEQLCVYYPITYNYVVRGYVVLCKPLSVIRYDANSVFNFNYITMLITLIFTSAAVIIFVFQVNKPLNRVTAITAQYAKGDFSKKISLSRNDEIGRLADSLDYMASEIDNLGEYQRKFIANISHDFRSPLTSIKGYLEAMLDGTIPVDMQEKYLNIVISETERLTKLTNNLLTMNNMNDGMVLDICEFDLVGIIKQTIETFEGTCARKKIKFKLVLSSKSLMVSADQSKIQQVIYNLVDNAIKFSSNDSSIIISATERGEKVMVSVKDFGIGIPKGSINKIWDRFYKTDLSRGKDKKGTGLGLSIVKEIITAHKEYIDVISTEGVGTEFIFALPLVKQKESRLTFLD